MTVSITEGNRRLLVLARRLDKVKPSRFNFMHWVGEDWKGRQDLSCGTTACALGHAASMPYFRKRGLRLARVEGRAQGYVRMLRGPRARASWETLDVSLNAAQEVFGIARGDAFTLFVPDDLPGRPSGRATPEQLARHIRKFVAGRASK